MFFRRLAIAVISLIMAIPVSAQGIFGDAGNIYYGVRLGVGFAHISSEDDILNGDNNRAGINLGGIIGFGLSDVYPIAIETGLFYTEKGGEQYYKDVKLTYDLNYLYVPVIGKYKIVVAEDMSVQPFIGGYLALGVNGKIKDHTNKKSYSAYGNSEFQRFDGGMKVGCGFEYQMMYIELAYDLGLSNISHSDFESSHNRCFFINAGINF